MAMEARRRHIIFEIARIPSLPRISMSLVATFKEPHTIRRLALKDTTVGKTPWCSIRTKMVVSTAGPTIRGTPKGTTPVIKGSDRVVVVALMSEMASTRRIRPPAILKSSSVIPKTLKINSPKAIKLNPHTNAVMMDSLWILRIIEGSRPWVKARKMGIMENTSTATKMGMKV